MRRALKSLLVFLLEAFFSLQLILLLFHLGLQMEVLFLESKHLELNVLGTRFRALYLRFKLLDALSELLDVAFLPLLCLHLDKLRTKFNDLLPQ